MKRKSLIYILLFISAFVYTSCFNEMEVIENEHELEIENRIIINPVVKALIDYKASSIDENSLFKIEVMLDNLYNYVPQMKRIIDWLVMGNCKFKLKIESSLINDKKSWYKTGTYPPEIGFCGSNDITTERLLHELLHHFAHYAYPTYGGEPGACEEYEVRVFTDLLMRKHFKNIGRIEYQGMYTNSGTISIEVYNNYIAWLDTMIGNNYYRIEDFVVEFKKYGSICLMNLAGRPYNESELNYYMPLLIKDFWFNFR